MTDPMPTPSLAEALAKVQAALPVVHKASRATVPMKGGGSYSYTYADLADVTAAIMPLLAKHGLAFTCTPRLAGGGYELAGQLLHTSGESIEGALPLTGGTPQQWGSSITYMRRYLLGCMTGVVTDDDDDARLATEAAKLARREVHRQQAEESVPKITDAQSKKIHAMLRELGREDRDDKLKLASWVTGRDITSTSELTFSEAKQVIDYLAARIADQQVDVPPESDPATT